MRIRIKGFTFETTYSAAALVSIIVITGKNTSWAMCTLAVVIHELGHIFAMKLCSLTPSGIHISAFNIRIIEKERHNTGFVKDIIITACGPAFNFAAYLLFIFLFDDFAYVNLFLGLFNILPAVSLDGGQLLYMVLSKRFDPGVASRIIDILTIITTVSLFSVELLLLFNSVYNLSLLFISVYLLLTLFFKKDKYL